MSFSSGFQMRILLILQSVMGWCSQTTRYKGREIHCLIWSPPNSSLPWLCLFSGSFLLGPLLLVFLVVRVVFSALLVGRSHSTRHFLSIQASLLKQPNVERRTTLLLQQQQQQFTLSFFFSSLLLLSLSDAILSFHDGWIARCTKRRRKKGGKKRKNITFTNTRSRLV